MQTNRVIYKAKTLDLVYMAVCAALMAICSWIAIPTTVPFTLQTFAVFLTVILLGGRRGTIAVLVYILLGAVGIPVFAQFTGGIGILLGSTGGYIVGFLFTALTMWGIEKLFGRKTWALILSMLLGLIACYSFGTAWYMIFYAGTPDAVGLLTALSWCVFPFMLPDLVKISLALALGTQLRRAIRYD